MAIRAGDSAHPASERRRLSPVQARGWRTDFIALGENGTVGPQAIFVEQDANWSLQTHYHPVHQFQVVVGGRGTLGKHVLAPFSVHYTSPESAYGPIVAGPEGLNYMTLRVRVDNGAFYIPESRERMRKGLHKVQVTADPPRVSGAAELRARRESVAEEIIAPRENGLAAWFLRVAPGDRLPVMPGHAESAGAFIVVAAGRLQSGGRAHETPATLFAPADESQWDLVAGAEGVEAMLVRFPREAVLAH